MVSHREGLKRDMIYNCARILFLVWIIACNAFCYSLASLLAREGGVHFLDAGQACPTSSSSSFSLVMMSSKHASHAHIIIIMFFILEEEHV